MVVVDVVVVKVVVDVCVNVVVLEIVVVVVVKNSKNLSDAPNPKR